MKVIINKDIRTYKVKDIGPFSISEAISVLCAIISAYTVFSICSSYGMNITENDFELILMIIPIAICISFGFVKPLGIPLHRFLLTLWSENIMSPKIRTYGSDFDFSQIEIEPDETDEPFVNKKYTAEELAEIKKWKGYK